MSGTADWIRIAKLESPKKAMALIDHFGGVEAAVAANTEELLQVDGITRRTVDRFKSVLSSPVDEELRAIEKAGARVVTYWDDEYPTNLRQIFDPPPVLFVLGHLQSDDKFSVAVVGTRRPSEYGKAMGTKLSRDLAKRGLTIVSGGARGIDTVAHTAVVHSKGRTIAVLGSGIDVPYPYENRGLLKRIAETGAVVPEFVPGTRPDAWRFPVRNRLVSGMSLGVLVVESLLQGGAMITASIAAEQGRDVWAMPGGTDIDTSAGPHRLIKEGAKLVETADDILLDLGIQLDSAKPEQQPSLPSNLTPDQLLIINVLTLHPKHVDDIVRESGLNVAMANGTLTLLEMLGLIRRVPGNAYVRAM